MKVEVEHIQNLPLPFTGEGRTAGVHVSGIIRCIAMEQGILTMETLEDLSLVDMRDMSNIGITAQLRIHIGLAWEEHYLPLLPDVIKHPGEYELDGIYMSPDAHELTSVAVPKKRNSYRLKVHEAKATYKSTNTVKDIDTQFMWLAQVKSYCLAGDADEADLHVLHLCGDYKMPIRPMLDVYHLRFTEEELANNWALLKQYRDIRMGL